MNSAVELPCCKGVRPGTNLRVHVVGEETFATLVHSKATDYRYGLRDDLEAADLEAFELTDELAQRCVCRSLSLSTSLLPASNLKLGSFRRGDLLRGKPESRLRLRRVWLRATDRTSSCSVLARGLTWKTEHVWSDHAASVRAQRSRNDWCAPGFCTGEGA